MSRRRFRIERNKIKQVRSKNVLIRHFSCKSINGKVLIIVPPSINYLRVLSSETRNKHMINFARILLFCFSCWKCHWWQNGIQLGSEMIFNYKPKFNKSLIQARVRILAKQAYIFLHTWVISNSFISNSTQIWKIIKQLQYWLCFEISNQWCLC